MGIFIYAFTATGKSTVSKKYSNILEEKEILLIFAAVLIADV